MQRTLERYLGQNCTGIVLHYVIEDDDFSAEPECDPISDSEEELVCQFPHDMLCDCCFDEIPRCYCMECDIGDHGNCAKIRALQEETDCVCGIL
jgi:hypothetical protein